MAHNPRFSDQHSNSRSTSGNRKPHISEKARQRPVRVIPADDRAEMEAGHLIASSNPFSSSSMITRPSSDGNGGFGSGGGFGGGFSSGGSFGASEGNPAGGFGNSGAAESDTDDAGIGGSQSAAFSDPTVTDDIH